MFDLSYACFKFLTINFMWIFNAAQQSYNIFQVLPILVFQEDYSSLCLHPKLPSPSQLQSWLINQIPIIPWENWSNLDTASSNSCHYAAHIYPFLSSWWAICAKANGQVLVILLDLATACWHSWHSLFLQICSLLNNQDTEKPCFLLSFTGLLFDVLCWFFIFPSTIWNFLSMFIHLVISDIYIKHHVLANNSYICMFNTDQISLFYLHCQYFQSYLWGHNFFLHQHVSICNVLYHFQRCSFSISVYWKISPILSILILVISLIPKLMFHI